MNVLLITFSFPPAGGVGVLRATSLAKYLPDDDIRVDVLTARNAPSVGRDEVLLKQIPQSVTVHRTLTLDLPFALRKRLKALLSRRQSSATSAQSPVQKKLGFIGRVRGFVGNLLLPDPQIGWLPFASRAAKRIIRQRNIDAVIITVPPFSSVRLASMLRKRFPSLPIILDFRDEWITTTLHLVSFNNNQRARQVALETEAAAVQAATKVVMVTENAVSEIKKRYPGAPSDKFVCIPNGFDLHTTPQALAHPRFDSRVMLTYIGSVYGSTNPQSFVEALALLPAEVKKKLQVRFIGRVETAEYRAMLESQSDVVEILGFVPQSEALRLLAESHFALLITHDPINVSAKFYDYLGSGKPILAAVHNQGEVRRLLEKTRAGWWADVANAVEIAEMLERAAKHLDSASSDWNPDLQLIQQFDRRALAHRYAALLNLLKGRLQ